MIMMKSCFCSERKKKRENGEVNPMLRIHEKQRQLLELIFDDLSSRNPNKKLNQHYFTLFISLTGLWGSKLFKYFTADRKAEINCIEFLIGIAKTIRAPEEQKISILFNFMKDPKSNGIRYKHFLKMLYHYSKRELKEILTNDGVFAHEAIIPSGEELIKIKKGKKQGEAIEIDYAPEKKLSIDAGIFSKPYDLMMRRYHDPGTQFMFKTEKLTYKISHCNMNCLTKQFASHIFQKFGIEQEQETMNIQKFTQFIKGNMTLFDTYFRTFHQNIWGVKNGTPNFLALIEKESSIFFANGGIRQKAHLMLSQNALFFAANSQRKQDVFRIIFLEGVTFEEVRQNGILLKDTFSDICLIEIEFNEEEEANSWKQSLKDLVKGSIKARYQIMEEIGTGRSSVVYRCKDNKKPDRTVALKLMEMKNLDPKMKDLIQHETEIMKILKSESMIKHYETIFSKKKISIITEYIYGEDLFEYVKRCKRLNEREAASLMSQIIVAVMQLHSMEIVHRDLKPQNIMLSYKHEENSESSEFDKITPSKICSPVPQRIKIIDFGFANYASAIRAETETFPVGTLNYMSPEVLMGEKATYKSDVFSIGSILYFMLRGRYAFESVEPNGTAILTIQGDYEMYDEIWEEISDDAKDLIQNLLEVDPENRITLREAISHPWFRLMGSSLNAPI